MDIPIYLSNTSTLTMVYGSEELRQSLYLLLKTWYGRFLQTPSMGSRVSPHVASEFSIIAGVSATVEQLHGCQCQEVLVQGDSVLVRVLYNGKMDDFEFSLV